MSDLVIDQQFVRALAKSLSRITGKEAKHTEILDAIAEARGWKTDALMHALKHRKSLRPDTSRYNMIDPACYEFAKRYGFALEADGSEVIFTRETGIARLRYVVRISDQISDFPLIWSICEPPRLGYSFNADPGRTRRPSNLA